MGHTACTEPQCLYKGALYLYLIVEYFINLGTAIRSEARRTNKNKSRIFVAKAGFNKKEILFNSKQDLNLRKKICKLLHL